MNPLLRFACCSTLAAITLGTGSCNSEPRYTEEDFATVAKIDAHVHLETYDTSVVRQAKEDNMQLFTINYDDVNEGPPMEIQQDYALKQVAAWPEEVSYATTFSIREFNTPAWADETLRYLSASFTHGAKAVKIYKVIGMSLRDSANQLVMIDDPRFDTILNYLESKYVPVVGHLGEPRNCWLPVDKMTVNGDRQYFTQHPEYHMFKHPELPSYEDLVRARDNMLARHPKLRFVGAHLGSLEYDVDSLAARLERFPNMAVDMAARIVHLQVQARNNPKKVRDFLLKYNDRLLYATDLMATSTTPGEQVRKDFHDTWLKDWQFFTSSKQLTSDQFEGSFTGMDLPQDVVDNIYRNNARKWLGIF